MLFSYLVLLQVIDMKNSTFGKYITNQFLIIAILLVCLVANPAHASSEIDVGLIVSQFSAELIVPSSFVAIEPNGKKSALDKGKYFIAANQGIIKLGNIQLPSGTILEIAEQENKEKNKTKEKDQSPTVYPRHLFTVNRQEYRGTLKIYLTNDSKNLTIVNRVPMEYYVNSVLAPKSSPIWPDEAIKAQAVAVRSLAWYYKHNPESELFAVRAVEPEAFYGGIRNENKNITKIAAQTAGQVLYYNGSPAMTYTCESSGGMTVSASEVLQKDVPYLQAVEDYDTDCPSFTWEKKIQAVTITRLLEQGGHSLGRLRGYRISDSEKPDKKDRYPSGRVKTIYWQGELGSVTMTGQEFADMLALSSNWFDVYITDPVPEKLDVPIENSQGMEIGKKQIPIKVRGREKSAWKSAIPGYHFLEGTNDETILFKGKGIGRGLGLSKWGAKGMADAALEKAENYYITILQHFYPGTNLVSVY